MRGYCAYRRPAPTLKVGASRKPAGADARRACALAAIAASGRGVNTRYGGHRSRDRHVRVPMLLRWSQSGVRSIEISATRAEAWTMMLGSTATRAARLARATAPLAYLAALVLALLTTAGLGGAPAAARRRQARSCPRRQAEHCLGDDGRRGGSQRLVRP